MSAAKVRYQQRRKNRKLEKLLAKARIAAHEISIAMHPACSSLDDSAWVRACYNQATALRSQLDAAFEAALNLHTPIWNATEPKPCPASPTTKAPTSKS